MSTSRKTVPEAPAQAVTFPYHLKYRPTSLKDVIGQDAVVRALEAELDSPARQHTFFMFGPPGTGKTTLSRIAAARLDCGQIIDVDAASNSGIDAMRDLMAGLRYRGFGPRPNKAFVIDECHGLSAAAQDSLLKDTEEPPEHAFFFFCSTNPTKIKPALLTRGPNYTLKPVRYDDLMDVLEYVAKQEALATPDWALQACARACAGSVRQALVMLAMVKDCATEAEAEELLEGAGKLPEVLDLCRAMVGGRLAWSDVQRLIGPLADLGAEGVRIQVTNYLNACLLGAKSDRDVPRLLDMLDAFSQPCVASDKMGPVYLALGKFVDFGGSR